MGKYIRNLSPGFTLVEVIAVVALLGIVLAVAVPSINNTLNEIKLDGAAQEVVSAIHYVRSLAIKEGVDHRVRFFIAQELFRCGLQGAGNFIYNPLDKKLYFVDFTAEGPLKGVDIVSADFGGMPVVGFNSLGEPWAGGSVVLAYAGLQKTINVTAPIGKVSVN